MSMSENLLSLTIKADKYLPINYNVLAYEEVCHIADVVMAHSNDEEKCQVPQWNQLARIMHKISNFLARIFHSFYIKMHKVLC